MPQLKKILLVLGIIGLIGAFYYLGLERFASLEALKSSHDALREWRVAAPVAAPLVFGAVYIAVAALSLPGAAILTLAAGALFDFWLGVLIVSFASTIGATLAFLSARFLLGETVRKRFGDQIPILRESFSREGAWYLFSLRLIPLFPFFVVNLVMGLTSISVWRFYWVSQLGMLAGTAVYVNAGRELGRLTHLKDIVSPRLLGAFVLLGLLPLVSRWIVGWFRARQVSGPPPRAGEERYNLVVIGGGAAGLVSAYIGAAMKARVALISKGPMGGDCLNTGCVPSKALIAAARVRHQASRAATVGLQGGELGVRFPELIARVRRVINEISPHDSVERYTALGVECLAGEARIIDPHRVVVNGRTLWAKNIIVATGAGPKIPEIPGLSTARFVTSDTLWEIDELPRRLVVLGGGPIGCELGQALQRLGVAVTVVQTRERLLMKESAAAAACVADALKREGVEIVCGARNLEVVAGPQGQSLKGEGAHGPFSVSCDLILVATGRVPNGRGLGLEDLGVLFEPNGAPQVDRFLRTSIPTIFACGDVLGRHFYTHAAAHEAWYAAVNSLLGPFKRFAITYTTLPRCTFTDPEVASVGISPEEARAAGKDFEVTRYGLDDLDRAIIDGEAEGFIEVVTERGRDTIRGVTIVGRHAAESLAEFTLAMRHGLGLNKILATIHPYPSFGEGNKYVAGAWRRAHVSALALRALTKFNTWRR